MLRRFQLPKRVGLLAVGLVWASGCGQDSLPGVESGMEDVRVEVAATEPMALHLASALVDPEAGAIKGQTASLNAGLTTRTRLNGDESSWDLDSGTVIFEGNVSFSRGDLQMSCDSLQGRYQAEVLSHATASGHVVVEKGELMARGARAEWLSEAGSITLTGTPTLEDKGRLLRGKQIRLFVDERRLECLECTVVITDLPSEE